MNHFSVIKLFISLSLLAGCSSGGDSGGSAQSTGGGDGASSPAAADSGGQSPVGGADAGVGAPPPGGTVGTSLMFYLPGVDGVFEARAFAMGEVRLVRIPDAFTAKPKLVTRSTAFPAEFDSTFCENVRKAARNATGGLFSGEARQLARESVRRLTDQEVDLPFAAFLTDGTAARAAQEAALSAGVSSSEYRPPAIVLSRVEIVWGPNALSRVVGDLREIEERLPDVLAFSPATIAQGTARLSTNAADFLCDLWAGDAQIVAHYTAEGEEAQTVLSGLAPFGS